MIDVAAEWTKNIGTHTTPIPKTESSPHGSWIKIFVLNLNVIMMQFLNWSLQLRQLSLLHKCLVSPRYFSPLGEELFRVWAGLQEGGVDGYGFGGWVFFLFKWCWLVDRECITEGVWIPPGMVVFPASLPTPVPRICKSPPPSVKWRPHVAVGDLEKSPLPWGASKQEHCCLAFLNQLWPLFCYLDCHRVYKRGNRQGWLKLGLV